MNMSSLVSQSGFETGATRTSVLSCSVAGFCFGAAEKKPFNTEACFCFWDCSFDFSAFRLASCSFFVTSAFSSEVKGTSTRSASASASLNPAFVSPISVIPHRRSGSKWFTGGVAISLSASRNKTLVTNSLFAVSCATFASTNCVTTCGLVRRGFFSKKTTSSGTNASSLAFFTSTSRRFSDSFASSFSSLSVSNACSLASLASTKACSRSSLLVSFCRAASARLASFATRAASFFFCFSSAATAAAVSFASLKTSLSSSRLAFSQSFKFSATPRSVSFSSSFFKRNASLSAFSCSFLDSLSARAAASSARRSARPGSVVGFVLRLSSTIARRFPWSRICASANSAFSFNSSATKNNSAAVLSGLTHDWVPALFGAIGSSGSFMNVCSYRRLSFTSVARDASATASTDAGGCVCVASGVSEASMFTCVARNPSAGVVNPTDGAGEFPSCVSCAVRSESRLF
mmetsp:Transcript_6492/g.24493  ORF Transcript_6492/g.24493 Transcript_6492/m.24493 type:complete len:461 (+) Transcript_6492:1734-3116(+)